MFAMVALWTCEFFVEDGSPLGLIRAVKGDQETCQVILDIGVLHRVAREAGIAACCAQVLVLALFLSRKWLKWLWALCVMAMVGQACTFLVYLSSSQSHRLSPGMGSIFSVASFALLICSAILLVTSGDESCSNSGDYSASTFGSRDPSLVGSEISFTVSEQASPIEDFEDLEDQEPTFYYDDKGRKILKSVGKTLELAVGTFEIDDGTINVQSKPKTTTTYSK